jgi:TANFOR domain-containing protein
MKNTFKNFSLLLLLFSLSGKAQNVTVTVQVLPPYSTYLPDYLNNPSRIIFTLTSNEDATIKLKASITGDNGISVVSSNSSSVQPINLLANQLKMMNGTDLKNYLDINSAIVTGINKNDLFKGSGIPEGIYTICIQALDFTTGTPLSDPEPIGCSNPFEIKQISPPDLIAPSCNETVDAKTPQSLVFSWLPPQGVVMNVQYKLKIVELIPKTRNPNEAMNSATTPAFFETTTNSLSFLYTPAQPALKIGSKYAWRVTVVSSLALSAAGTQSNFQNNGNSEVCSFEYIKEVTENQESTETVASTIKLVYPIQKQKLNNGIGFDFSWKPSTNPNIKEYQVQMTGNVSEKQRIKEWSEVSEALFKYQYSYGTLNTGLNLSIEMPANFNDLNGKNAWRVVGLDENKKVIDASSIETYEIVELATTDRIKLVSPIQGKKIPDGYGLKFEWQSSKKQTVAEYQLQYTNRVSEQSEITNWSNLSDDLFESKSAYYVKENVKDLFFNLSSQSTSGITKMAWRIVGLDVNGFVVDKSNVETYEIVKDDTEIGYLQAFEMAGYYIKINKLFDKNPDKFSGTGSTQLWAGGPEVAFNFSNLKVKPYKFSAKAEGNLWMAIDGEINVKVGDILLNQSWIDLETQADCDGTFQAKFNILRLVAKVDGAMDSENKLYKISKDNSFAEAKVIGKWITNWFIPENSQYSDKMYEFLSNETNIKMSFINKFDGELKLNLANMVGLANGRINVFFNELGKPGEILLKIKALTAETSLTGSVFVDFSNPKSMNDKDFETLVIPFKNQKNLNFKHTFENPIKFNLNDDGSAKAEITEAYVHLSDNGILDDAFSTYPNGLNFDKFKVVVTFPSKPGDMKVSSANLYIARICNKGFGYYNAGSKDNESDGKISISGYTAKINESKLYLYNNKLSSLFLKGFLYVPFLNDWSKMYINIDNKKLQSFDLNFDYNKKYYLNESTSKPIYISLASGRLEGNNIIISPYLHVKNNEKKGFETENFSLCDMQIDPLGAVSFDANFASNSESICEGNQKFATYYRFNYPIDKIKLKQKATKNDIEFVFSGDVILTENITTKSKKETGFVYHGKDPNPDSVYNADTNSNPSSPKNTGLPKGVTPKGPAISDENSEYIFENTVELTDDKKEIQASYEDGAQKFGGGMKLVENDPVWGNYFELSGGYIAKEPSYKELSSKLILGKTKNESNNYSYWFFEFNQIGIAKIPIVPGVIEAHGFGGKAYHHMNVVYDNSGNIKDMNPNKDNFLGIAATAYLETAADEGHLLHAKTTIETKFNGLSIDKINYFIEGDALSKNNQSDGLMQTRLNGQLNFNEKYIDGTGSIWGGIDNVICIGNENQDNLGFHFGTDDFYINVGTKEAPITADVFCGGKLSTNVGTWLTFSKSSLGFGMSQDYNSGWIGANLGIASAGIALSANLKADVTVAYSPFQATGTGSFTGTAYGKGCVDFWLFSGCISGSIAKSANLTVTMPNPVSLHGSISCKVRKYIPSFTMNVKWSSDNGFQIWL